MRIKVLISVCITGLINWIGCTTESKNPIEITQQSNLEIVLEDTVSAEIYCVTIITENRDTTRYFEKRTEGSIKVSVPQDIGTTITIDIYNMNKKTSTGSIQLPSNASGIFKISVQPSEPVDPHQLKAPTGLNAATVSATSISISFDSVEQAQKYRLYVSHDNDTFTFLADLTVLSYTHIDLKSGTTYYYRIASVRGDEESAKSSSISVTTQLSEKKIYAIDSLKCIGCGRCRSSCKFGAIIRNGDVYIIDPSRCTGCGECIKRCPRNAISLQ